MGSGSTKTLTTSPDERGGVHRVIVQNNVIEKGKRKLVFPGVLVNSWRAGDDVVVKTLQNSVPDEAFWLEEIEKCSKLREHVLSLSKSGQQLPVKVHIEYPMTAYIDKVSKWMKKRKLQPGEFVLVEETLGLKYALFMDSHGKLDSKLPQHISEFLAELMHFTYHESCRKMVFCGFQGTFSKDRVNLAEPTVHSVDQVYRETDQGLEGIITAFDNHRCTTRCRDWLSPHGAAFQTPVCTTV